MEADMTDAIEKRRFDTPDDVLDMKDAGAIKIIGMMSTGAKGMIVAIKLLVNGLH